MSQPSTRRRPSRKLVLIALLAAALGAGCASQRESIGYYWQSVTGHLDVMQRAEPVEHWIEAPDTPAALRDRLRQTRTMRDFAVSELALPDNDSYRRYADLQRRAAVWNVVAAPELSLELHRWCFPVVGCVGYKGYYDEARANQFAESLPDELEVTVYPVPAYSTLGWTNWLGGDPLLNTFVGYPEGELAKLMFHELAHQVVYAKGDTVFNESFATTVERLGGERWLEAHGSEKSRQDVAALAQRRSQFKRLTLDVRGCLEQVYTQPGKSDAEKREAKAEIMNWFHQAYETQKAQWGGYKGYDGWVKRANNASFGAQAAYDRWVPALTALFHQSGDNFPRFYEAVRELASLDPEARLARLTALTPAKITASIASQPPAEAPSQEPHVENSHPSPAPPGVCRRPEGGLEMGRAS
ncbi:aminopeptidase [Hydrogenophaga sp. 5NK40-0174]|uniref:aminopeptidase n=1 Tax=Hydrogenophaga sp. 5NK40-0174 TaxID=3127649 RepID=UPI0031086E54